MVLSMDRWVGKVAVVTGASSGIGADIAERLVREGVKVVALARRKERLDELSKKLSGSKGKFYAIRTDMCNEGDIKAAFAWIKKNLGVVHILINNAGVMGEPGENPIIQGKVENWKAVLDTNVLGLCVATQEALKNMKEHKVDDGHVVNVCSVAGHYVLQPEGMAIPSLYTASKHAVMALSESLRLELIRAKSKIKITNLSPGLVKTEIFPKEIVDTAFQSSPLLNVEDISDAIIYALSTPPHVQIHELMIRPVGEVL